MHLRGECIRRVRLDNSQLRFRNQGLCLLLMQTMMLTILSRLEARGRCVMFPLSETTWDLSEPLGSLSGRGLGVSNVGLGLIIKKRRSAANSARKYF